MEKIYAKLEKMKQDGDKTIVLLLKLFYKFFLNSYIVGILNVALPVLYSIPVFNSGNIVKWGIVIVIALIIVNIGHIFTTSYRKRSVATLAGHSSILGYVQSICKKYNERVLDYSINGLFECVSDAVCTDIYHFFKDVYNIEARVSVVQQYEENGVKKCVMISRTSKNTQGLGKKKDDSEVKYGTNHPRQKYYKKILKDNKDDIVVLFEEEIKNRFVFKENQRRGKKKRESTKIYQYICIPQKVESLEIAFIFQIDIMESKMIGENEEEVKEFCNVYFEAIMRILQNAYIIENKYKNERSN